MVKARIVPDDKFPSYSVEFEWDDDVHVPDAVVVELAEDEARLVRRFKALEAQYDALCSNLLKRK